MPEFQRWPSTPRLFRDVTITEKIDGTNAAVGFTDDGEVYAQSRSRIITPEADNHGFARWVHDNVATLFTDLGPGLHFGEWWGSGIQRGYGLPKGEKRLSLFNTKRYGGTEFVTPGLGVVPVLYEGKFNEQVVHYHAGALELGGSVASPGFGRPEGIIVYHHAAGRSFKFTPFEKDDGHKG